MLKWRDRLQPQRGTDPDRTMAKTLQHHTATFLIGLPAAGSGIHRTHGPNHGLQLTFKPDQLVGMGQLINPFSMAAP
jgi:hypothetical protein